MPDDIIGRLVFSKSGRDRGRPFVVLAREENGYLVLADGDLRKIDKPKRKNIRHVQPTKIVIEDIARYINQGKKLDDQIIRRCLQSVLETISNSTPI